MNTNYWFGIGAPTCSKWCIMRAVVWCARFSHPMSDMHHSARYPQGPGTWKRVGTQCTGTLKFHHVLFGPCGPVAEVMITQDLLPEPQDEVPIDEVTIVIGSVRRSPAAIFGTSARRLICRRLQALVPVLPSIFMMESNILLAHLTTLDINVTHQACH